MFQGEISKIKELLSRLREVDRELRVFGSESHRYKLGPMLTEAELQVFEQSHNITLPIDYRLFLREIGNGGAGPFYGLSTLAEAAQYRDLSKPFPFNEGGEAYSQEEIDTWLSSDEYVGVLEICHQGCGWHYYLVVNGLSQGKMWDEADDSHSCKTTFGAWYLNWAEKALRILANEALVGKLRVGMTQEQVIAATGSNWREREVASGYYFEAPEIPAQIILSGANGVVKAIEPWTFITARP